MTNADKLLPDWVPEAARDYVAHTVEGRSIRALARAREVHPSTILRQVRQFEARRDDDPLVDAALRRLTDTAADADASAAAARREPPETPRQMEADTINVLRRLCEPGAVMAVAPSMNDAVVVREDGSGETVRTAIVDARLAQALALQNWISCADPSARISRYFITAAGRTELRRRIARSENVAFGFSERTGAPDETDEMRGSTRFVSTETPLMSLARRRDTSGKPFLNRDQVRVGERLREDFVLSGPDGDLTEDWRAALDPDAPGDIPAAVRAARRRTLAALHDLGPGLQDAALRCCCLLEGLEVTERAMGWSARSGKIVLRIALERLRRHYADVHGTHAPMIG